APMPKALERCPWPAKDPLMLPYHDEEWGVPLKNENKLFEFLVLEGAQAGLSWRTVLYKRENYRKAFANFDPEKVACFTPAKINQLLKDPGIIRNRLKVESAVANAQAFLKIQDEFGSFAQYSWDFVQGKPIQNRFNQIKRIPARTEVSDAFSKDMKKRGFRFVGSTILYAHMQAVGMVNDHVVGCFRHAEVSRLAKPFLV